MNLYKKIMVLCGLTATTIIIIALAFVLTPQQQTDNYRNVTEFYFVRHGQTDHNAGLTQNYTDMPLNQTGIEQAHAIKAMIAMLPIKSICCSPLLRAQETKDIIAAQLQIPEYTIYDLREWNSEKTKDAKYDWKKIKVLLKTTGIDSAPPLLRDFIKKVHHGLQESLNKSEPVLIIAHGGVYYALCCLLKIEEKEWRIDNCVPVRFYVDADDNKWKIERLTAMQPNALA